MTERTVTHATFVVDRIYDVSPARVFAAWSRPEAKARWFACHDDWQPLEYDLDFRVGGVERLETKDSAGVVHAFEGRYHDIVPEQRIIYSYAMFLDETRISVSLVTVVFEPEGEGTRLTFTEQGAFLDGYEDVAGREEGTRAGLSNLAAELGRGSVEA